MKQYLIQNMESITWNQVQTMDLETAREAAYRMELVLAMVNRRHRISWEDLDELFDV